MIEFKDVSFGYNEPLIQIDHLKINRGEKLFVLGPSGSGKSTFLNLVSGILRPQKGSIEVLNESFNDMSASGIDRFRGQHFGYIFQGFNLVPYLSVLENILLPSQLNSHREGSEDKARAIASKLGLQSVLGSKGYELSVGQQQRTAAARALLGNPEIIIADEPTSSLDHDARDEFLALLFEMGFESTILFVSHDQTLKERFDRVLPIKELLV